MTKRARGALSGRNIDEVRMRRNQQTANQASGSRLAPPLYQDELGRFAIRALDPLDPADPEFNAKLIADMKAKGWMR